MDMPDYGRVGTGQTGLVGEHLVTAELLRRGWLAAMIHGNSPLIDILASKGASTIQIQVKTRTFGAKGDSLLPQAKFHTHIYYVVAELLDEGANFFIMPGPHLDLFYYRSPCGVQGRIRYKQMLEYKSRWDLLNPDLARE